ncbi:class I adenylate-forming enzyme family protein [Pseudohalioglobus lutimaris]|uniref:2,3-dihydroxybenzoate-AMP ligase n=1 Tax=Pseudohalioglobus lutimaris TaxID=1737061 RepID=A0A2N5X708_9GAMM|nr:class I adenylate-forming enzyme family protein [Pseudohalioglobus lutimaris]PLW70273.1 2,3-dihydroxybenzoate-AMP ligase [Pseudohalioglobus lutimaris]
MITSNPERIDKLTRAGVWGEDTLHQLLTHHVAERPDMLAVADQPNRKELTPGNNARLNFRELDQASDALATALLEAGLGADDRVIVQLPNIAELVVCYYAASKLGIVLSPIPVQYGAHELRHVAAEINAQALITCERFKSTMLAREAKSALPEIKILCWEKEIPTLAELVSAGPAEHSRVLDFQRQHPVTANHIVTICWTSGTTGTPKGVPRSHNMWLATAQGTAWAGDYQTGDRLLMPFPMVNMAALGGFLFSSALRGCSLVLHHPFDAELYLQQLQDEHINFSVAPPAVLNQLAKSPELWQSLDLSSLRAIGSGAAPLAPWMVERFEQDYGLQVINFYGSNEGISLHSTPATAPSPEIRATMFPRLGVPGLPWEGMRPGVITRVANPETGEVVTEPGIAGELLIAGPTVFDGYYGGNNEGVFSDSEFFRSGDLVEICGEAPAYPYYRIVGRCKDIINRGGMKISPTEIDLMIENFPGVAEAAVCAYPDERLGERVCACLVMADATPTPELGALQEWLLARGLAKFKLPERIQVLDALPRNALDKVQRNALTAIVEKLPT